MYSYHVQINARCDADVEPSHIMKKVADSSGAKYSIHNEKPVKREMPAPVVCVLVKVFKKKSVHPLICFHREQIIRQSDVQTLHP